MRLHASASQGSLSKLARRAMYQYPTSTAEFHHRQESRISCLHHAHGTFCSILPRCSSYICCSSRAWHPPLFLQSNRYLFFTNQSRSLPFIFKPCFRQVHFHFLNSRSELSKMHFTLLALIVAAPLALTYPVLEVRQASSTNLQSFTGTLGGAAPPITNSGDPARQFEVNGNTFVNFAAAAQRSCDIQQNACSNAANSGKGGSVAACQTQQGMKPSPLRDEDVPYSKDSY